MDIVNLLVQLISGAIGGHVAGMDKHGMGPMLDSILGGIGGIILGQVLVAMTGDGATAAPSIASIATSIIGGGAGGAILTVIAGFIKSRLHTK
ncbi:hypothetical protein NVV94_18080 [Pseudomonas sp. LS1212]|uniref:hypothetical protein n=1 Tax=Pseudomonas sp. LS1212 TaxID=2972478 RepID=UPI00215CEC75|nr:hypothetical protein [Pseudomonas sp. LS1212]UVJ42524.1 hypothetical protein NVV94_18080 [Pseudomonas sp. LS1212]